MSVKNILILCLAMNYAIGCFIIDCPPIKEKLRALKRNYDGTAEIQKLSRTYWERRPKNLSKYFQTLQYARKFRQKILFVNKMFFDLKNNHYLVNEKNLKYF